MRRYFFIDLPNENVIHALNVCIGDNNTQRFSLDGSVLLVKTTNELLAKEQKKGVSLLSILPPGLTEEVNYEDAKTRCNSLEFQEVLI